MDWSVFVAVKFSRWEVNLLQTTSQTEITKYSFGLFRVLERLRPTDSTQRRMAKYGTARESDGSARQPPGPDDLTNDPAGTAASLLAKVEPELLNKDAHLIVENRRLSAVRDSHWVDNRPHPIFANMIPALAARMPSGKPVCWDNWHTYQVLTRSVGMRDLLCGPLAQNVAQKHVWWGVSVENRRHGFPRIADLQATPAAVRFLSVEPLIEDFGKMPLEGISWVIVRGESGPCAAG